MKVPDENFFISPISNPRYIKKNYPEFFDYLTGKYPNLNNISEKIYWWKHNLTEIPVCDCGRPLHFISIKKGYTKFCSVKCSRKSEVTKAKAAQTCLERYGVDNPLKSNIIHNKVIQTCLERYGVDNPFKSPEIIEKIKQQAVEKYGVEWFGQSNEIKEKIRKTCQERYGVSSGVETGYARMRRKETNRQTIMERYVEVADVDSRNYICKCPHPECNKCVEKTYQIPVQNFFDRRREKTEPCTKLLPIQPLKKISGLEVQVQLMLDELGLKYQIQNNDILEDGTQLDLYIPSHRVAIEVNGCYNHSIHHHSKDFDSDRQYKKYIACKNKNIRLISIWEDWLKNKPDIVRSILRSKFGAYDNRIGARKCEIKEISTKVAKFFLEANHIQGYSRSKYKYGLYFNHELVSVMTFSEPSGLQGHHNNGWILNRFCTKLNTQVVGGANKLLHCFIESIHPNQIISYSSNDISDGSLYRRLGFVTNGTDSQCYWYIKPGTLQRWHRTYFNKSRQLALGFRTQNDPRTEIRVMMDAKYMVCYDTYLKTWTLQIQ